MFAEKIKARKHYLPQEKIQILVKGYNHKGSLNDFCLDLGINPSLFYRWRKEWIRAGLKYFQSKNPLFEDDQYTESLESENRRLKSLLSKLSIEIDLLKKKLKLHEHNKHGSIQNKSEKQTLLHIIDTSKIHKSKALKILNISRSTYYLWLKRLKKNTEEKPIQQLNISTPKLHKYKNRKYIDAVFSIMHTPPIEYGINRTTWRIDDLYQTLQKNGFKISKHYISKIIKNAGYRYRKAQKVLTSNDPSYCEKVAKIGNILSNLRPNEKFFSIDEFGPFAVKMRGGKKLFPQGEKYTIPQFQKSKGWFIITGALELSTNQVTHFYSNKKDTNEIIKLLNKLIEKYSNDKTIYLSWDAASWHISKKLKEKINEINELVMNRKICAPFVEVAPLPASAQFLNVIESIYSGMARAIIHNSNYESVKECKVAIDRYFAERNKHFREHPKPAGKKIWRLEPVIAKFSTSNNCKDSRYR